MHFNFGSQKLERDIGKPITIQYTFVTINWKKKTKKTYIFFSIHKYIYLVKTGLKLMKLSTNILI